MDNIFNFVFLKSPLEQFNILSFSSDNHYFCSNFSLYLIWYLFLFLFFTIGVSRDFSCLPTFLYRVFLSLFSEIRDLSLANAKELGSKYLSYFFYLTMALFFFNTFGMVPYGFTITSHLSITFFLTFVYFFSINFMSLRKNKLVFFSLFLPSGTPFLLMFLLVPLEVLSYIARLFSLSIRLFANMMAGHTLLHILVSFLFLSLSSTFYLSIDLLPYSILFAIVMMELAIAFLQIYVFVVLSVLYLHDTYHVAH